jgi:hypothetical protein
VRRRRNKLKKRYGQARRRPPHDPDTAVRAVDEPQHGSNLEAVWEHGQEWVNCRQCGRQWSIHGSDAEVVSEGDGYCDENPEE